MTNGYEWLFVLLNVNPNGKGASYRISDRSYSVAPYETGLNTDMAIPDMAPDMIAGILVSWVSCHLLFECLLYSYFTRLNTALKTFWKMIGLFDSYRY